MPLFLLVVTLELIGGYEEGGISGAGVCHDLWMRRELSGVWWREGCCVSLRTGLELGLGAKGPVQGRETEIIPHMGLGNLPARPVNLASSVHEWISKFDEKTWQRDLIQ